MRRSYGVDVGFPANLEGLSLETTIRYRSIEELGKHAESLSRLANSEDIKGMFELLKGEEV